jgi:hypothetical protein
MLHVLGLVRGGPETGWLATDLLGAVACGLALLGVFTLVERRAREPLLPLRLLTRRTLVTAIGVILSSRAPSVVPITSSPSTCKARQ